MRHPLIVAPLLALLPSLTLAAEPLSLLPASTPNPIVLPNAPAPQVLGLSLYWDNDGGFAKPNGDTDKHYTAGPALSVYGQAPWINSLLAKIPSFHNEFAPQHSRYALAFLASLNIYTPENITDPNPIFNDRPYAGWTYLGFIAQRAALAPNKTAVLEHFELDLGMVGYHSYAQAAQTWIHEVFDYTKPEGWDNQIRDEFGADFKYQRRYRFTLLPTYIDVLPEAGFTLGTIHINANAGATLRAGFNLPDDFGPVRSTIPQDFTKPYARSAELTWENLTQSLGGYLFARASGFAVAHDTTLQGSFWSSSPVEVSTEPLYAELQYGLAIQFLRHIEFTYSQTWRSPQFDGQRNWDSFGSLTLSFTYAW